MSDDRTPTDDRDAMLRRGDELWERLAAALDASMDGPLGPATDWTGHNVYAHFARWQAHTIDSVRRILAGQRPVKLPGSEDEINERWASEDGSLPVEIARESCIATRKELRDLLEGLTLEQWDQFGRLCSADISGEHYEHHLTSIAVEGSSP